MKKVQIKLVTVSSYEGEDDSIQTLECEGRYQQKGGSEYLLYREDPLFEGKEVRSTLILSGEEIRILRHGAVESSMTFRTGEIFPFQYHLSGLDLLMETETSEMEIRRDPSRLVCDWTYALWQNQQKISRMHICLSVEFRKEETCESYSGS